ncbi:MAG: YitT family protein [Mycoplasmoidaceae bacterium]
MKKVKELFTKIINPDKIDNNEQVQFEKKFFKSSTIRLSEVYAISKDWQKYLIVIAIGLTIGFLTLIFLKNTGLYSMGISAVTQGISRLITSLMVFNNVDSTVTTWISEITFWFSLFLVNLPLSIFARKYIGNKFTFLTLTYLLTSSMFPFALTFIPGVNDILIFGNVKSNVLETVTQNISILTWDNIDRPMVISLLFYAIFYPFIIVALYTIIYALGGSTGGSDIISIYYLKRKLKSLGEILIIINFVCVITGSFIGSYLSIGILEKAPHAWSYQNFFSPNLLCSICTFSIFGTLLQVLYPRFRVVSIKVIGKNVEKINEHLNKINCVHSRTISRAIGSYSKQEQLVLEMYLTIIELGPIINEIRQIDDKVFIIINKKIEIDGNLSYPVFLR